MKSQSKGDPALPNAGRPKKLPELADLMNELFGGEGGSIDNSGTKVIFDGLMTRAKKGDTRAAEIILAYSYGKPKQAVEHSGPNGGAINMAFDVSRLTDKEAADLLALMEKAKNE